MDKSLVQAAVGLAVDMEQVGSARQLAGCRRAGSACRHNLAEASGLVHAVVPGLRTLAACGQDADLLSMTAATYRVGQAKVPVEIAA